MLNDICAEIVLFTEDYVQTIITKYSQMLLPLMADKNLIRMYWKDIWNGSNAGKGLEYLFRGHASTKWLIYLFLNGRDYVDMIKLITQTLPCRAVRFNNDKSCWMGCQAQESLCHILQKCPGTHYPQVRWHNDALNLLVKALKYRGYNVRVELHFQTSVGLCKLDILAFCSMDGGAYVINHTVV